MAFKASHGIPATLLALCVTATLAFAENPSALRGSSYASSVAPFDPTHGKRADKSVGPDLAIEVREERLSQLVAAHQKVVKELIAVLQERDAFGVATVRAHLAAKALIDLEHRGVLPFLAQNIAYSIPLPVAFTAQPILEASPYLLPLMQHEVFGARAIVAAVARRPENGISDREWMLYGYVLVNIYGDDANGRNAAIALIDRMENDLPKSANLALLRDRVRTAKRVLFR